MKLTPSSLPVHLEGEYARREEALFRSRVELYILISSGLYFAVSLQYLFRKSVLQMDTFRPMELTLWVLLLAGSTLCYRLNRSSKVRRQSKKAALIYTGFFVWALSGLSVMYPENTLVFGFYYAFAVLATALLIPWKLSEIFWIGALYLTAFFLAYDYVAFFMMYPVNNLPRFYTPVDGSIFIVISSFLAGVIRRKEIERDIQNFILLKKVESQNAQMDSDLELARRVHKTLVPDSLSHERADIWVSYIPMSYVSGDYAKFRFLDPDRLLVFISDVTGHGVAAALLVNRVHAEFERLIQDKPDPGMLLKKLNDFISKDFEGTQMYLSAFCGVLDFEKKEMVFSNHGHPSQFILHKSGDSVRHLASQNTLLGITMDGPVAGQVTVRFELGDRFLFFTDGVTEASDASGQSYGEHRLKEFLKDNDHVEGGAFNDQLIADLTSFQNGPFADDLYILNVKTKTRVGAQMAGRR